MTHHSITRVLYVSMIGFLITGGLVIGIYANTPQAFATPGAMPFGGKITAPVPAVVAPPAALCPAHSLINNGVASASLAARGILAPAIIGIYTLPPYSLTFLYGNMATPGVNVLGEYAGLPFPTCKFPYPVYLGFFYPIYGRFGIGTAAIPGF